LDDVIVGTTIAMRRIVPTTEQTINYLLQNVAMVEQSAYQIGSKAFRQ